MNPAATTGITITKQINFTRGQRREKRLRIGPKKPEAPGRIPRVSRLLALAIEIDRLVHDGTVKDYAEAARLGHITRARMAQVMNLLSLAPDIIEELLHLPRIERGDDPITERHMRPIARVLDWRKQRALWRELKPKAASSVGRDVGARGEGAARRTTVPRTQTSRP